MKRNTRLAVVGLVAAVLMASAAARMFSAHHATRAFGDLTADRAVVTPAPYTPPQGTVVYWPHADLSNSGEFMLYQREKAHYVWAIQIATVPGGQVVVDSVLPSDVLPNPSGPRFSPDGGRIVFCGAQHQDDPQKTAHVSPWVVNADGNGLRRLRDDGCDYGSATWQPDGKAVALTRGAPEEIVFLDPETGEVLSTLKSDLQRLRFSPDGKWLLGNGPRGLTALEVRTGEERVVWDPRPLGQPGTEYEWWTWSYAWAFDSRRVFFTAGHRDWESAQGPTACEIWEGSLDGPAGKIMDGQVLAGSLNGKYILIDKRRVPSRDELRSGDVQLLTLKP